MSSIVNWMAGQSGFLDALQGFEWIRRAIVSLFLASFISFMPLFINGQSLVPLHAVHAYRIFIRVQGPENGKMFRSMPKRVISLFPTFAVFSLLQKYHSMSDSM
jgi:hypothetical protein